MRQLKTPIESRRMSELIVGLIGVLLFAFVFLLLLVPALYLIVPYIVSEFRFRARMWRCGRLLRLSQLHDRVTKEGLGTLIINSPSLGWGITQAWWTPEKVLSLSPYTAPTDDEYDNGAEARQWIGWDRWIWEN